MNRTLERPHKTIDRFDSDPELSYIMPASYYFDPEFLAQEKRKIFHRSWQMIPVMPKPYFTSDR